MASKGTATPEAEPTSNTPAPAPVPAPVPVQKPAYPTVPGINSSLEISIFQTFI